MKGETATYPTFTFPPLLLGTAASFSVITWNCLGHHVRDLAYTFTLKYEHLFYTVLSSNDSGFCLLSGPWLTWFYILPERPRTCCGQVVQITMTLLSSALQWLSISFSMKAQVFSMDLMTSLAALWRGQLSCCLRNVMLALPSEWKLFPKMSVELPIFQHHCSKVTLIKTFLENYI